MNKRQIDKTKKSNIKCEHCKYWKDKDGSWDVKKCELIGKTKNYYNRCKSFEWREDI